MSAQPIHMFGRMLLGITFIFFGSLTSVFSTHAQQAKEKQASRVEIINGTFANWTDGKPDGWEVGIGATDGAENPVSSLKKGDGPSLELAGDQTTKAWQFVSQSVDVKPGDVVRVSFSAKATGLKRQGFQKDNCFVGFVPMDRQGQRLGPKFWFIDSDEFKTISEDVSCPDSMAKAEVWVFLSKTGTLTVKDVKAAVLKPKDSFDVLVADMGKNYSFFEHKKIDWPKLSERYRERATTADSPEEFSKVVTEMLGELNDVHTWVVVNKRTLYPQRPDKKPKPNSDFNLIAKQIKNPGQFRGLGIVGTTESDFCYINLRSLTLPMPVLIRKPLPPDFQPSRKPLDDILKGIVDQFDAPGMIVDLRINGGGSEDIAKEIAGLFITEEIVYAKSTYRDGDGLSDFGRQFPRSFRPTGTKSFKGPVVCLIGPNTVSSAEGMAMMMKAVPNCILIGKPTRGASGNPKPVRLPNGVSVWYSRWKSLLPDGTCIEGTGVEPDIEVDHVEGSDLTFEKAISVLKGKQN